MSYQIPSSIQADFLLGVGKFPLYKVKPTKNVILNSAVITLYMKGNIGADFKMKINIYKDSNGNNLLLSSLAVNNLQINRVNEYYCELRFDFPADNNRMSIGVEHLVEFEVYDSYVNDNDNFLAIVKDTLGGLSYVGSDVTYLEPSGVMGHKLSMFFGIIESQNDEKFFMLRMAGSKLLNGVMTYEHYNNGSDYYFYQGTIQKNLFLDWNAAGGLVLYLSGVTITATRVYSPLVLSAGLGGVNRYYYNPSTGLIQLYLNAILGFEETNMNSYAILNYYLFFSNYRGRYADPYMSSFPSVVYWEPRLGDNLNFDFSQGNNFNGVLSISSSSIDLKNEDKYMNDFFSINDCFNNRELVCWSCNGSVENCSLEFIGTIRAASIDNEKCTIEIQDILATLDNSYNDSLPTYFYELQYTPTLIRDEDKKKIIPRMFGRCGPYDTELFDTSQAVSAGVNQKIPVLNGDKMTELVNVSYNPASKTTSTNRSWSMCFGPTVTATKNFTVASVSNPILGSFSASALTITPPSGKVVNDLFRIGDTFSQGSNYGRIYEVTPTTIFVWPYNAALTTGTITRHKVSAVVIKKGGDTYYPLSGRDYTCSLGVDNDVRITFSNNFEVNHSGLTLLDPDECQVFGRVWNDDATDLTSEVVKSILNSAGITTAGSFAPAQNPSAPNAYSGRSYPDPMLSFTVPFVGTENMPSFRDVIELCLKTAASFVYFDNNGFARYKSFLDGIYPEQYIDNQSGVDPIAGEISEKNSSEFVMSYDFYDLYSGIVFNFSHQPNSFDYAANAYGGFGVGFNMVKDFYRTNRKYEIESVADVNDPYFNNYVKRFINLATGRRCTFSLKAYDSYGIFLGDDLKVSKRKIIGADNSAILRVVSISKGINSQNLSLLDIKRFPTRL